ncbi:Fur family transcriptional regulator [Aminivibrio sp.]|jgi:Fe2+ or Zn2+ uptake regulation protein|uniref:Fur family transcriptional regulator n=1 Tax=Aminivibrio sp. TaxID=1872489 RepID=UPI001A4618C1|nr:Fur family transcriptional regulator [Aminivibrio sp.]MBL3538408.1 transcriptional repressor [Aminivibrio sp.]MDK2958933.1 Fur family transcriptional regulator, peroxide stress response regulator [Synergistaceae bacterium]
MRSVDKIAASLREKGLKLTPQRRLIIEILSRDRSHPTVDEVYRQVVSIMPEVSRTTVYNTIREMASLGEIAEVQDLSDGGIRYDTCAVSHNHFFCLSCRSLIDVDVNLPGAESYSGALEGFQVLKQQLTLYGLCPDCRDKGLPPPGKGTGKRALKKF